MQWPSGAQYSVAIQKPESCFSAAWLKTAVFDPGLLGLPAAASGQTAMVFRAQVGPKSVAVRVFTAGGSNGAERYRALAQHVSESQVSCFASAAWIDDAIVVDGQSYPLVAMEWVDGEPLSRAVESRLSSPDRIRGLATMWRHRIRELGEARVAHGDLQHGNVLVDSNDQLRFIDFDGVWVPAAANTLPTEFGHPNYQHPDRTSPAVWGEHIDWFAALSVFVSLQAIAVDPSLWDLHHGDNLIFNDDDFRGPTEVWSRLERSSDPAVVADSRLLAACCESHPMAATSLEQLLSSRAAPSSTKTRADDHELSPSESGAPGPKERPRIDVGNIYAEWETEQGAESAVNDDQRGRGTRAPGAAWVSSNTSGLPVPPRSTGRSTPKNSRATSTPAPLATGSSGPIPVVKQRKRKPRYSPKP